MKTEVLPKAWESLLHTTSFLPVIVKSIERFYDATWSMEPNSHEFYEMVYIKKGKIIFDISGVETLMGANDIIIIKPDQFHKLIVKSETGCEFIVLNFTFMNQMGDQKENSQAFSKISLGDFLNFVSSKETGAFLTLKVSQKNDIITLLNRIVKEKQSDDIGSEFLNYLLVMELFVMISRALKMEWEGSIEDKSPKIRELVNIAENYIINNFEKDISLKDISKFVFLSQSYFARVFKQEKGISPISYLLKVRVERAKELLLNEDLKVSDIALSVGFSNQQRFNEIFKKYTKYTPLQFRKAELNNN